MLPDHMENQDSGQYYYINVNGLRPITLMCGGCAAMINQEAAYLETVLNTILSSPDLEKKIIFSRHRNELFDRENCHLHDMFEFRLLCEPGPDRQVDYTRIQEIRLSPPGIIHPGLDDREMPFHITIRWCADMIYYLRGDDFTITLRTAGNSSFYGIHLESLSSALESYCRGEFSDLKHLSLLLADLISMLRLIFLKENQEKSNPARQIMNYIHEHYYRPDLTIAEIAKATHFSPNYIQKILRSGCGCTPIQYLNEVRLNAARRLLRQHRYQVKEVAALCGWNYVHYFCRRYHEKFGILPSEEK